ncbi:MAG: hypothetical protein GY772_01975 [bacterium]|nr:hypothetical protein [bacterium]
MSFGYKICPLCCPEGETYTNRHERTTSPDGAPVWRCLCCSNEIPRRTRRSPQAILEEEARAALGLVGDSSLEAVLAVIDYGQRKAAGVPLTGDLTLEERFRLLDAN